MEGYIVLETGEVFKGTIATTENEVHGEIVFFSGATGYQEVLSNPSCKGQLVVFTYPLIGNYGINESDFESVVPHASALIVSEVSEGFHYEKTQSLVDYCSKHSIPLVTDVDTRAIVKRIREHGDMRAVITTNPSNVSFANELPQELVSAISVTEAKTYGEGEHHVVLVDCGYKKSIVDSLLEQGCKVTVVPYQTSSEEIAALSPDGVLYSNGPGNPKQVNILTEMKKVASAYPTMGIGLGHQLLALAFGADTKKLSFGHRGTGQPVIDLVTNRVYMTAQNHSYVVDETTLAETEFDVRFRNINDRTVEGLAHKTLPIMAVQFHPEANPGPSDSEQLFYTFIEMLRNKGREKVYA